MSCAIVPTETQFQVVTTTSDSLSTFFSTLVTTASPTTVTSTIACSDSVSNSSCAATTLTVTRADPTTISVPVTLTVPVTFTRSNPTLTLFSTSCSSSSTSASSTDSPSSNTLTSQPQSTPTSLLSSTSVSSLVSSPVIPSSDGNVITTQVIVTTTSSPPSIVVTSSTSPSLNQSSTGGGGGISPSKAAPIIGGAIGGAIVVLAIIGAIWYFRLRGKLLNDIVEEDGDEGKRRPRMSLGGEDVQPRPYHYGLVGHASSPSPPGSPPFEAVHLGHSPSNSLSFLNAPPELPGSSSGVAFPSAVLTQSLSELNSTSLTPESGHARPSLLTTSSASTLPLLERPLNHTRTPSASAANLSMVAGSQLVPLSPQPHSVGRSLQSAPSPAQTTSTEPIPHPQHSPNTAKRRLLASLPQGAAPLIPPSLPQGAAPLIPPSAAIESGSSVAQFPRTESVPPPIRRRNPNRRSSSKGSGAGSSNAVTVHVDGGPAAETEGQPPPGETEPPAYSPT